jgi:arsenite transporter
MHAHTTNIPSGENREMASQETAMVPEDVGRETSLMKSLSFLDRFLAVWILLAMALGIILGYFVPKTQVVLNTADFVGVSVPIGKLLALRYGDLCCVAVGLIVMMYPILCKVRFEELNLVFKEKALWKQLAFSFVVNWIIAPLVMVTSPENEVDCSLVLLGLFFPTRMITEKD